MKRRDKILAIERANKRLNENKNLSENLNEDEVLSEVSEIINFIEDSIQILSKRNSDIQDMSPRQLNYNKGVVDGLEPVLEKLKNILSNNDGRTYDQYRGETHGY